MREKLIDDLLRWNFNRRKHDTKNKKKLEEEYQRFKRRALDDAKGIITVDEDGKEY